MRCQSIAVNFLFSPQKPRQRTALVSGSVPELGTLPAQSLTPNLPKNWRPQEKGEPRQEFAASEEGDRGVHVFVHQDDDDVTSGADSDEEQVGFSDLGL